MNIENVKYEIKWRKDFYGDHGDDDDKCIMLVWNKNDDETDDIMEEDFKFYNEYKNKKNMMWLNDIRKMTGIKGYIYLDFKQNCGGCVHIWVLNYEYGYMKYISKKSYWALAYSEYNIKCNEIFADNKQQTYRRRVVTPNCVYQNKKRRFKIVDSFNKEIYAKSLATPTAK